MKHTYGVQDFNPGIYDFILNIHLSLNLAMTGRVDHLQTLSFDAEQILMSYSFTCTCGHIHEQSKLLLCTIVKKQVRNDILHLFNGTDNFCLG